MAEPTRCVVFAYSDVGFRCLSVLLESNLSVSLVVTHTDQPGEERWFSSVAELAGRHGVPVLTWESVAEADILDRVRGIRPAWIFSFYFRAMLSSELLSCAAAGALNMHGSLLPRYRGRAPINWAILRGERETGATLHRMTARPDQGDVLEQMSVPILLNDTALDVSRKVGVVAELLMVRFLDKLRHGALEYKPQDDSLATYFGKRTAEDGLIDWRRPALVIHNLVRAVAPPFPGAYFESRGGTVKLLQSYYTGDDALAPGPRLYFDDERLWADCIDGRRLLIVQATLAGQPLTRRRFESEFGAELAL
ncbi:MAG: formyltransferase [Gammaproteobacteria bacterium]